MEKKETSKTFSVRTEIDLLNQFDKILTKKGTNKNKFFNDTILSFVIDTIGNFKGKNIDIKDNINRIGYERNFFNSDDCLFVIEALKILNQGLIDDENILFENFIKTGIKYSFSKIGITIYSVWEFNNLVEELTKQNSLSLNKFSILHHYKDDTIDFVDNLDFINFTL